MSLGKLRLPRSLREIVSVCSEMGIDIVDITAEDCICLDALPWVHRDPFDRIILSHAVTGHMPLITHDANFHRYDYPDIIW